MRWIVCLAAAASIAAFGCGGSTEPLQEVVLTMENISGIYYGVTFTTEEGGVVTDQLRHGASIEFILFAEGGTSGRLVIPADSTGCCAVDVGLNGTWALDGNIVTLALVEDTFMRSMTLAFEQTHLSGETTIDGVTYRVVLGL